MDAMTTELGLTPPGAEAECDQFRHYIRVCAKLDLDCGLLEKWTKWVLVVVLEEADYNKTRAAKVLGVNVKTIYNMLHKYKIDCDQLKRALVKHREAQAEWERMTG